MRPPRRPVALWAALGALGAWRSLGGATGGPSGDGFAPAEQDAWKRDRMAPILRHVFQKSSPGDMDPSIALFDEYSEGHRMGMNLGAEKGDVIEQTVRTALTHQGMTAANGGAEPFAVLEIGAHFGDGTLRIVRVLQQLLNAKVGAAPRHVVVSLESNPVWASGCKALVDHAAGKDDRVEHLSLVAKPASIVEAANAVRESLNLPHFNVIMLDHDHEQYLPDLQKLVESGALAPNALVHADNAGRNADVLKEYLRYVMDAGPFSTNFEEIHRPYSDFVAISHYKGRRSTEL